MHVFIILKVYYGMCFGSSRCVEGGSTHYVRGYFHCVPLLRPEEREFSPSPNKGTLHRQWFSSTGILASLKGGKPFTTLLWEAFQLWSF